MSKDIEEIRHWKAVSERRYEIIKDQQQKIEQLEKENTKLKEAMQWFIDRCDKGEVRSKKTYARFKELLTK